MPHLSATFLILAALLLAPPALGDDKPVLIVSGSHDWAPYLMIDPTTGQSRGALHDVLVEACRAAGADCLFVDYPWKRVLDYLDHGDIDVSCGIYSTVKRRGQYIFSPPIYTDEVRVFSAKPLVVNDIKDLRGLRGDAQLGASFGDAADAYISQHLDVARWTDKERPLLRLLRGDTEYVICPHRDCMEIVRHKGWEDRIRALPHVLATNDVHIAFSRHSRHADLIPAINRELGRLVKNGRARELLEPYLRH